jgi:L-aminopeptidase/D-esterase-like protein
MRSKGLTEVEGLTVGQVTLSERPTGCTVILVDGEGAPGGVAQRGGAPGTRETDLLDPRNLVDKVNAIVLSGGSAFGLDAAQGVSRYLEERKIGWSVGAAGVVPIVPAAILFDLGFGGDPKIRPTADCGYRAAGLASTDAVAEGSVGAGAGATLGKVAGRDRSMKGGIGTSAIRLPNGPRWRRWPRSMRSGMSSIPRPDRSWPACGHRTASRWPTRARSFAMAV